MDYIFLALAWFFWCFLHSALITLRSAVSIIAGEMGGGEGGEKDEIGQCKPHI